VIRLAWDLPKGFATDAADAGHIKTAHTGKARGPGRMSPFARCAVSFTLGVGHELQRYRDEFRLPRRISPLCQLGR